MQGDVATPETLQFHFGVCKGLLSQRPQKSPLSPFTMKFINSNGIRNFVYDSSKKPLIEEVTKIGCGLFAEYHRSRSGMQILVGVWANKEKRK